MPEQDPKLWVDIKKTKEQYPDDRVTLPDFVVHGAANTLVALHGRVTWETLEYLLACASDLLESLESLARSILSSSSSRRTVADPVRAEARTILDVVATEHGELVRALALVRLPLAVAELEDIFVPTTRLDAMRAPLAWCIRETAAIGEVLDGFVQRGMRKRMRFVRSARLFERERLKRWRMDGLVAYQEVGRKLDQLVASCKSGWRFNIAPNGDVRFGFPSGCHEFQDPQVAFDEAFKHTDIMDGYLDFIDIAGLGPRRTPSELAAGGHLVITVRDEGRFII